MKSRSMGLDHGTCLKSVSRAIRMQGFIFLAITTAEKCTLFLDDVNFLDSTLNFTKSVEREM